MPSSRNAEKLLRLSLVPKRKAKKVSCRQKPNIGLQLVSLSYGLCVLPCFCNPGLWVLQKLTSSNIYIDGEGKMWRQLSADKKHSSQSKSATSFPLGLGRPTARNFSSQSLQKLTQSVTDCIWCDSWAPLVWKAVLSVNIISAFKILVQFWITSPILVIAVTA